MALMNRGQDPGIETVFMMPAAEYSYLRASIIKEIARFGGSVEGFVPEIAKEYLTRKLARND
jgi:pantetheine-phosphate adenylyltransferase